MTVRHAKYKTLTNIICEMEQELEDNQLLHINIQLDYKYKINYYVFTSYVCMKILSDMEMLTTITKLMITHIYYLGKDTNYTQC